MPISLPSSAAPPPSTLAASEALLFSGIDRRLELNGSYLLPLLVLLDDAPATPSSLTLRMRDPTGAAAPYSLSSGSVLTLATGRYGFHFIASLAGRWTYTWTASFAGFSGTFAQTCSGQLVVYRNLA